MSIGGLKNFIFSVSATRSGVTNPKPENAVLEMPNGEDFMKKRLIILTVVIVVGLVAGRLALRAVMNLMLGGTMFGGNFL